MPVFVYYDIAFCFVLPMKEGANFLPGYVILCNLHKSWNAEGKNWRGTNEIVIYYYAGALCSGINLYWKVNLYGGYWSTKEK